MAQKITKKYCDVDVNRMTFTDLEENSRTKGQKIAYVRYNDSQKGESTLIMQTPWITLDTYGIPRTGEYYKDENSRSFIKVPLDCNDDSIKVLYDKMTELDKLLIDDDKKTALFGSAKMAKQYDYQPIIRTPVVEDTLDDSDESGDEKPKYARPPYMKTKFHIDWESGDMKTKLYKRVDSQREEINVRSLVDVEKLVTFKSKVRLILMPNKLWALKTYNGKKYGLSWKVMQIEVEPVQMSSMKNVFESDAFLDSDDEGQPVAKVTSKVAALKSKDSDDDSDDDSSDSDDDSDDDVVVSNK